MSQLPGFLGRPAERLAVGRKDSHQIFLVRLEGLLPLVWEEETVIVAEKAANVVENEAASQVSDTFPEKPVKPCRGTEPRLFVPRHDVGKIGGRIQNLDILVVRDRNLQVDAVALQHGVLVLPGAELLRAGHALQHVHRNFHHEAVGVLQAMKMLEEIAGFVVRRGQLQAQHVPPQRRSTADEQPPEGVESPFHAYSILRLPKVMRPYFPSQPIQAWRLGTTMEHARKAR